jgi:FHA domain-containing protein/von Willebrand factor type A domain-containing protein
MTAIRYLGGAAIVFASLAPAMAQQQPATPGKQAAIRPIQQTTNVLTEVACNGQRVIDRDDKAVVRCTVRFNSPITVQSVTAFDPAKPRPAWIASFQPFTPENDDTAFYLLVDRTATSPADGNRPPVSRAATISRATRELYDVFKQIGPRQRVAIASYATDLTLQQNFTSQTAQIQSGLNAIRPSGAATELYRHALDGIRALAALPAGRRVLIIVGTGRADDKAITVQEVENAARGAGVRIVTIGYAEQDKDSPFIQNLDQLSERTRGVSYRARNPQKTLPEDFRRTILTHFGSGGTIEASFPSVALPDALEMTITQADGFSRFQADFKGAPPSASGEPAMQDLNTRGLFDRAYDFVIDNYIAAIAVAIAVLVLLLLLVLWLSRRKKDEPADAFAFPPPRAADIADSRAAPAPAAPPPPPAPEPAAASEPPDTPSYGDTVVHRAPEPEPESERADGPVIAYLEFNAAPGRYPVRKKHLTIGRQKDNDVVTDAADDTVSRHHVVLSINTDGRFQVTNRSKEYRSGSANPVFVNGDECDHAVLSDGDTVKLGTGNYGFVFRDMKAAG